MTTPVENQRTVCDWATATFGQRTDESATRRMMQEVEELVRFYQEGFIFFPADAGARAKLMNEMADVVITMYAAAASIGGDLHAEIDRKMQVNRKRKWKLHGDGTGQHVDE